MIERGCYKCGKKSLYTANAPPFYCSDSCKDTALVVRQCPYCDRSYASGSGSPAGSCGKPECRVKLSGGFAICKKCSTPFPTVGLGKVGRKVYCSDACRFVWKPCEVCKKPFKRKNDKAVGSRFCSHVCGGAVVKRGPRNQTKNPA